MRDTIERSIKAIAYKLQYEGLFKTIQFILFGNHKNVCPKERKY